MSQNQEIIESKLCAYIDGELDAEGRAEIEKHLEANPQHRRLLESLRATRDLLRWLPREPALPEVAETLNGQLERSVLLNYEGDQLGPSLWPRVFAAAAIIVLTAGLGVAVYYALPKSQQPAELAFHSSPAPDSGNADVVPAPLATTEEATSTDRAHASDADAVAHNLADATNAKAGPANMAAKDLATAAPPVSANNNDLAKTLTNLAENERNAAELDQLARQVAQDPGAFVASVENESNRFALAQNTTNAVQNAGGNNPVVLLVKSNAPDQTERQLTAFFREQQIEWRQAPLNAAATSQQAAALGASSQNGSATAESEKAGRAMPRPTPTDKLKKQGESVTPLGDAQPNAVVQEQVASKQQDALGSVAQQQPQQQAPASSELQKTWQANTARSDNVYVCQMSRRQVAALSNTISTNSYPAAQVNEVSSAGSGLQASGAQAAPASPVAAAATSPGGVNGQFGGAPVQREAVADQKLKDGEALTTLPSGLGGSTGYHAGVAPAAPAPTSQAALNLATTQPAAGAGAGDEPLNVVIMVEASSAGSAGSGLPPSTQPAPAAQPPVGPAKQ